MLRVELEYKGDNVIVYMTDSIYKGRRTLELLTEMVRVAEVGYVLLKLGDKDITKIKGCCCCEVIEWVEKVEVKVDKSCGCLYCEVYLKR